MAAEEMTLREPGRDVHPLTVRTPQSVYQALRTLSFVTNTSINDLVLRAVTDFLASEGHRETVDGFLASARKQYRVALDKLADM